MPSVSGTPSCCVYKMVFVMNAAALRTDCSSGTPFTRSAARIAPNTVGGDIEAGLAIAELIAGMKKPTVSLVLGGGHSIGIPLAVSAKRAIIAPRASMTVHPVRMTGLVVGAPQTYHYFDQIQDHIVDFVTENSRISRADFARYMMATGNMATDVGTVLYGAEAVESGLMDQLGSLSDALAYLHAQIAQEKKKRSGPDAGGDN